MRLGCLPGLYIHADKELKSPHFPKTPPAFAAPLSPTLRCFSKYSFVFTNSCTVLNDKVHHPSAVPPSSSLIFVLFLIFPHYAHIANYDFGIFRQSFFVGKASFKM